MTLKQRVLRHYLVSYSFKHQSGRVATYSLAVPAETAEDAKLKATGQMRREGTPMERVQILSATSDSVKRA